MWKIDPKDKYIHKYKHDYMYIYVEHVFNSGTIWGDQEEEGEEKGMDKSE
jgi:hypothetical protein